MQDQPVPVTAAIILKEGKILLAQRLPTDRNPGLWEFPGGKIEPGETPEVCLKRELEEEFGIIADISNLFAQSDYRYNHIFIRLLAYNVTHWDGDFQLHSHAAIVWVLPEELLKYPLSPADIPIAQKIVSGEWCE
jgi:8-oxo-dGTP diphosphatase